MDREELAGVTHGEPDPGYPNLHRDFGWRKGVHRAPTGYLHPWLVVTADWTGGCWTRDQARYWTRRA